MRRILLALSVVPFLFLFLWMAFPATSIQSIIEESLNGARITGEVRGLKKGLLYTVSIDRVVIKDSAEELVSFEGIRCRINPFGLLRMRLDTSMSATLGSGRVSGDAVLAKTGVKARIECQGIDMQKVPFLRRSGIRGTGQISGSLRLADDTGRAEFATSNAVFEPADFSGIRVPMNFFDGVKGALSIGAGAIEVRSVALTGKDIYARLKGVIRNGVPELSMELMPGRSFLENPLFVMQLDRYRVSPGYYVIPVRGDFSR